MLHATSRGATIVAATPRCERDRRRDVGRPARPRTEGGVSAVELRQASRLVGRGGRAPPDRPRRRASARWSSCGDGRAAASRRCWHWWPACARPGTGQVLVLGRDATARHAVVGSGARPAGAGAVGRAVDRGEHRRLCASGRMRRPCAGRWSSSTSPSWRDARSARCRWASSNAPRCARAAVADPKVLLADEPTSFQDDAHTEVVVRALRSAADRGAAVLVATHDDCGRRRGRPRRRAQRLRAVEPVCSQVGWCWWPPRVHGLVRDRDQLECTTGTSSRSCRQRSGCASNLPSRAGRPIAPHTVTSRPRESEYCDTKSRLDRSAWPRMPTEARSAGCSGVAASRAWWSRRHR